MDTVTKIILGALIGVFSACAVVCGILVNMELALVFTGLATSGLTAVAGIAYGGRSSPEINLPSITTVAPDATAMTTAP
jgi:hypothetical protein